MKNQLQLSVRLLLLVASVGFCHTRSISIVDTPSAFPFLRSVDNPSAALTWDSGTIVQLLSSCQLIRITRRGVRCISAHDTIIQGWYYMFTSLAPSNEKIVCSPSSTALCATKEGNRFFPTDIVRVSDSSVTKCRCTRQQSGCRL
jgi:hypothetical protein